VWRESGTVRKLHHHVAPFTAAASVMRRQGQTCWSQAGQSPGWGRSENWMRRPSTGPHRVPGRPGNLVGGKLGEEPVTAEPGEKAPSCRTSSNRRCNQLSPGREALRRQLGHHLGRTTPKINRPVEDLLHLMAGARAELLDIYPPSDQDAFLAGSLHQHVGQHGGALANLQRSAPPAQPPNGAPPSRVWVSTCSPKSRASARQQLLGLIADCVAGIEVRPRGSLGARASTSSRQGPPRCLHATIWPR